MAHAEKLPWELIEEILSRVPPKPLVRFKAVSKQWKALFEDKMFINNHKATFRFILATKSKIYSVSIDPKIEVRELTLDIPGLDSQIPEKLVDCNGFLLCVIGKRAVVWNPWLRTTRRWIEPDVNQPASLQFKGIGYGFDNGRLEEDGYKTLASYYNELEPTKTLRKIHDFALDAWKDHDWKSGYSTLGGKVGGTIKLRTANAVSLLGNLYWLASYEKTDPLFSLVYFTFSTDRFYKLCDLPCGKNHLLDALVLRTYKGERLSLLHQCHLTKKIEIWVTKTMISNACRDMDWMNFMEVSVPNLPDLVHTESTTSQPSYFIDHKKLVVCSYDETGRAWIYVLGENKLISKVQIDSVVDPWPLHCNLLKKLKSNPQLSQIYTGYIQLNFIYEDLILIQIWLFILDY